MKNIKVYISKHVLRVDGYYYDQVILETKRDISILFERRSKQQ